MPEEREKKRRQSLEDLKINPISLIGRDWMLITAGNKERGFNTMTASWGHMGSIWGHAGGKASAVIYIRPQRYTKRFVDREAYFTLSFFPEAYKKDLAYLGSHSGRDEDKLAKTGLTPLFEQDYTYFQEAHLVLVCRKLYQAPILEEGFIDKALRDDMYPRKDFHEMYVGEIVDCYGGDGNPISQR